MADITQPTFADGAVLTAQQLNDSLFNVALNSYEQLNGKLGIPNLDAAFLVTPELVQKGALIRTAKVSASSYLEFEGDGNYAPIPGAVLQFDVPVGTWRILSSWSLVPDVLAADYPNTEFKVSDHSRGLTAIAGTTYRGESLYQGSYSYQVVNLTVPSVELLGVWAKSGDNIQIGTRRMCVLMIKTA